MNPCYLHPDREAVKSFNLPCAPGGKIWVCSECESDPSIQDKVWAKYQKQHHRRIELFKQAANPNN